MFEGREALMTAQMDPYLVNHPLSPERIAMLEERVAKLPRGHPADADDVYWYNRMVAKLKGFLQSPAQTMRDYPRPTRRNSRRWRAVAYYQQPNMAGARPRSRSCSRSGRTILLSRTEGQFLLQAGQAGPAVEAYRAAVQAAPKRAAASGRAGAGAAQYRQQGRHGRGARRADPPDRARQGKPGCGATRRWPRRGWAMRAAALDTAERYLLVGQFRDALRNADHASAVLPYGSPGWRRARDITSIAQRALKKDRPYATLTFAMPLLALLGALPARAEMPVPPMTDAERSAFQAEVHDYLIAHPEVLMEMMSLLDARQKAAAAETDKALVAQNSKGLFDDGYSRVAGNPDGGGDDRRISTINAPLPQILSRPAEAAGGEWRYPADRQGFPHPRSGIGAGRGRRPRR